MGPWRHSHWSPENPINSYALITVREWGAAVALQTRVLNFQLEIKALCFRISSNIPLLHASHSLKQFSASRLSQTSLSVTKPEQGWIGAEVIIHLSDTCQGTNVLEKFLKKSLSMPQLKNNYQKKSQLNKSNFDHQLNSYFKSTLFLPLKKTLPSF